METRIQTKSHKGLRPYYLLTVSLVTPKGHAIGLPSDKVMVYREIPDRLIHGSRYYKAYSTRSIRNSLHRNFLISLLIVNIVFLFIRKIFVPRTKRSRLKVKVLF